MFDVILALIPAAIFGAGVGTLIYQLFTKFQSPVFLGSSFAFISSLCVAVSYGYGGIVVGATVAGLAYVALAIVVHFVGTAWVAKLMPPVVIGPTVTLIGLSLAGNAVSSLVKSDTAPATSTESNYIAFLCGMIAFFTIVICSIQKKRTMPKLIPFVIGIVVGYAAATIFTVIGMAADIEYLKVLNWDPIINTMVNADGTFAGISAFFTVPKFAGIEAIKELATGNLSAEILAADKGAAVITLSGIAEVVVAFLPVALVVFAEHIADHKNLSSIIEKDLITEPGLKRTLLGDGVGSIAGTVFGVCPNTTYGESVGCVAVTRNASVVTITTTAFMCIILSFFSPLTAALQTIPSCVMGGVCLTLYGFIAVSGLKMLKKVDMNQNRNLFVIAAILISGIGGLTIHITDSIQITTIASALILGILTNSISALVEKKKGTPQEENNDEEV